MAQRGGVQESGESACHGLGGGEFELARALSFTQRKTRSAEKPVISGFFGTDTKIAPQNGKLFLYQSLFLDMCYVVTVEYQSSQISRN